MITDELRDRLDALPIGARMQALYRIASMHPAMVSDVLDQMAPKAGINILRWRINGVSGPGGERAGARGA